MFTVAKKNKVKVRNFSRVNSQETANTYACFLHQPLPDQGFWNPQFAAFKHTAQTDLSLNVQAKNILNSLLTEAENSHPLLL